MVQVSPGSYALPGFHGPAVFPLINARPIRAGCSGADALAAAKPPAAARQLHRCAPGYNDDHRRLERPRNIADGPSPTFLVSTDRRYFP
jgi:hypothetical protein